MQATKPILDPYKTIGLFVQGPVAVAPTMPFAFAVGCHSSFKIYSEQLTIKMVSPCFQAPVRALALYNQYTYALVGHTVYKIRYHHVVREWDLPVGNTTKGKGKEHASLLVFDGLVMVSLGANIFMIPEPKKPNSQQEISIEVFSIGINPMAIVHPVTYINKVIAYSADKILLVNPVSQKILYEYSEFTKKLLQGNKHITVVCPTPLIDIIAVGLDSGQIAILNIRTSKLVFTMKQKKPVTAIAFSQADSLMASSDDSGNIILWNLQHKKIVYRLESAFTQPIDSLFFIPGLPLLTATSSKCNAVRQFRINLDDSRTLSLFRQRVGSAPSNPITSIKAHNNKQITYSTKQQTVFSSLYSHSNMYTLPACLDSSLPYHLYGRNFNVELMKQRTVVGRLNIHQNVELGKFSISSKYVVVCSKSRMLKLAIPSGGNSSTVLHISCEWKISNCSQLVLCNQHSIFAVCFAAVYVFDFSQPRQIATLNQGQHCYNAVSNINQTMLALQNRTKQTIQIWDMRSITLSREFKKPTDSTCTKLCFTTDNRYLLSAQVDHSLMIWSVLQSNLYKTISLQAQIVDICFTPDNGYMLSVFAQAKEINIWHNYIGKITSTQEPSQSIKFHTSLNYLCSDFRAVLNSEQQKQVPESMLTNQSEFDALLDQIQDAEDAHRDRYSFQQASKWLPLVYYDEIKNRNSISKPEQVPSLPFFLDFKNISQQQEKISKQMRQQVKDKRAQQQEKVDANLQNNSHQISLTLQSTPDQCSQTWAMLSQLSVAQLDYQLRKFLLLPTNAPALLRMLAWLLGQEECENMMQFNVVVMRVLDLAGNQLCSPECKEHAGQLLQHLDSRLSRQQTTVQYCMAVASNTP